MCAGGMPVSLLRAAMGMVRQVGRATRIPKAEVWSITLHYLSHEFRATPRYVSLVGPGHQVSAACNAIGKTTVRMTVVNKSGLGP